MKDFIVSDEPAFRIRVKTWKCLSPKELNAVEFIKECKDKDGNVEFSTTDKFIMTDESMRKLAEGLLS